jgi:hypothetical protein
MRFQNPCAAALVLAILAATGTAANAKPPKKTTCARHADCGPQNGYCQAGTCKTLSTQESLLGVGLEQATAFPAYLYVDGVLLGTLPWEGIVAPGPHAIRVECEGMAPVAIQGMSTAGAVDYVPIRMEPAAAASYSGAPGVGPTASASGTDGHGVPGTFHFGVQGGFGYGTAIGAGNWRRPIVTLLGGVTLGLRVVTKPIWLDVGIAITSTSLKITDYVMEKDGERMEWGDFFKLNLGLDFRLLFPIKRNFFYIGAELEPGAGISNHNYIYGILRLAMSLFVHELVEIRLNPLGLEFIQELAMKNASYIVSYTATIGILLRFPKKPLF